MCRIIIACRDGRNNRKKLRASFADASSADVVRTKERGPAAAGPCNTSHFKALYPAELSGHFVPRRGLEPRTSCIHTQRIAVREALMQEHGNMDMLRCRMKNVAKPGGLPSVASGQKKKARRPPDPAPLPIFKALCQLSYRSEHAHSCGDSNPGHPAYEAKNCCQGSSHA